MTEETQENDPLQSIIAEILDAEARGDSVHSDEILRNHPQHERSLREFFANHDSMKRGNRSEEKTLPPGRSAADDATLPPAEAIGEDPTLPPSGNHGESEATVGDEVRYFGDYELLEEIARGGMGVVYKARQVNLNRIVALKMILAGQLASEEDVRRFYSEAEAAANLDHPGIVPIFEVGQQQGLHYFSMAYIEGRSLSDKVADGPLSQQEASDIVSKVCEAMAYAHERGVIHRDLKPANILLDKYCQPKVTDFGLAKKMNVDSGLTGTGQILGTPSYMAPEQAGGRVEEVGPLADVYALGAILYCLLTGRPPFQASNPMDTLLQVLEVDPAPIRLVNRGVDRDLETICLKCLEKDSKLRYSNLDEMKMDLAAWTSGEPISARSVNLLERISLSIGRSRIDAGYESWSRILITFSVVVVLFQLLLFWVIGTRKPLWMVLGVQSMQFVFMGVVLVCHRSKDLRPRNSAQKQIWTIWFGFLCSCGLIAVISQVILGEQKMYEFFLYPYWAILSGFAFLSMGGSYWGQYYLFAIAFFVAAFLSAFYPFAGPILFGALWFLCLLATGLRLQRREKGV